ncbi:MAG TPA: hypothetical protein VN716_28370 [Vicinamibacterales bacterium]|nr:hypothetical protein [Vicinamibacterales bacterium]
MLAYFMNFRVPGVNDVVVFRDHADPQQFYILNDRPRIAVDGKTGMPLFEFTLFSRNIEIAYASAAANQPVETQLGALNMTVDLSVSDADQARIAQFATNLLKEERVQPSAYNKLYKVNTTGISPRIGYIDWLTGTVKLETLEQLGPTFKRASSPETTPTLHGTNKAALWATFGTEGAQLMWGALHPKKDDSAPGGSRDIPLQANITYKLEGLARLPGIRVTVTGDASVVYQELRNRITVTEHVDNATWTYPQISKLTKDMVENRIIHIVWDDYGIPASDPAVDQIKQQLEQAVMGVITNQIVGLFFKAFELQGLKDEDLGTTFTHTTGGKPGSRLWLNEFKESSSLHIEFTMEKSQNFRFPAAPQTSLLPNLTDAQRDQLVRVVDVGSPEVRVMTVQVYTNADFATDKIANITTTLSYRQFDTLVNDFIETSESFVFKTGQETFTFRTRLARDAHGRLIDLYDAKAQINYIGVAQSPAPIELKNVSERALTFSYDRLGYVKAEVQAGDIDWTQISDVFVDLLYPSAAGEPDTKGTVHLTETALKGQWSSSKHGRTSNQYQYVVRYKFKDGHEETAPSKTDDRGTLVVHDTLVGRLRRTFDVMLDPQTVNGLTLKVRYEAPPEAPEDTRHQFTETGSWDYVRPLREHAPTDLKFAYDVQYKDGESDSTTWSSVTPDQELPSIRARRYKFDIMVDGGGLDWTKWRVAHVDVTYKDDTHGYEKTDTLHLDKANPVGTLPIQGFRPDAREYEFHAVLSPIGGGAPLEIPGPGTTAKKSGVLLLETVVA